MILTKPKEFLILFLELLLCALVLFAIFSAFEKMGAKDERRAENCKKFCFPNSVWSSKQNCICNELKPNTKGKESDI